MDALGSDMSGPAVNAKLPTRLEFMIMTVYEIHFEDIR